MSSESLSRQNARAKPFQFTLRQIFLWTLCASILLAIAAQFGLFAIPLFWFAAWIGMLIYAVRKGSVEFALCGVLVLLLGACLGAPAIQSGARSGARRSQCSNNLKNISLALQNYHDTFGSFPPAFVADESGRPMHSWRVLILPFMENKGLYDKYRFDEPWDGPNNSKLAHMMPEPYRCPHDFQRGEFLETSYLAVIGPETVWPGEKSITLADVADGTSNTLLVVEVHDSGIHWMEPRDLHMSQMPMLVNAPRGQGLSSEHPHGAQCAFVDGHVQLLTNNTPAETLRALLTISGGENIVLP